MSWYVLQCKPSQQQRAEANLRNQGFEIYSPFLTAERIVRRQRVVRRDAIFPGYIFIQLDLSQGNWGALRNTRGVGKIISFNGYPSRVSGELIDALRQRFGCKHKPITLFREGDKVLITEGCFKNIEAIVKAVTADDRISVLLNILHSPQIVNFQVTHVAKVGQI
ncbi:transcription/translation regulatory transformer protein RfaH [Pseudohongiella sp. SYSU M77423]|uniref:transcription/translation regulatory transformer protein RfaH n=1 Tax=Pseudohongiella sp. SYSU M77423 TaxID=3042312 RepID=UPI00248030F0|nr:transcription/translation regulatory transformer protein RfaH [Pseudohongiella sp. SYSU M77423]MDH7944942.1 transcription/translation regulatory transformer protein RfaH [Pseudohongiella sp. SYSU M77423]